MATISENLQTIKDSTDAIKQAIVDKGGTISGDITTWADTISGLSGGGSSTEEEITFTGTITYNLDKITLTGVLSDKPEVTPICVVLLYVGTSINASRVFISDIYTISLTINTGEPLMGNEIPSICLVHPTSGQVFPVTFIKQIPIKFYVNNVEYDALYPMTWEQFVNSETYNPTLTDINGTSYQAFSINDGIVYYELLYDGEFDNNQEVIYVMGNTGEFSTNIIKENEQYICD